MTIRELKQGDWFTKKPIENPNELQVWIRAEYDRSCKKYVCYKWGDLNYINLLKGDTKVYVDFVF